MPSGTTVPLQDLSRSVPKILHRYPMPGGTVVPLPEYAIKSVSDIMFKERLMLGLFGGAI